MRCTSVITDRYLVLEDVFSGRVDSIVDFSHLVPCSVECECLELKYLNITFGFDCILVGRRIEYGVGADDAALIEDLQKDVTSICFLHKYLELAVHYKSDLMAILPLDINVRSLLIIAHRQTVVKVFYHWRRK